MATTSNYRERRHPKFSWIPILVHFIFANAIAYTLSPNHDLSLATVLLAKNVSKIIPSISGYMAMAPDLHWAAFYLLICWLGAPFYILFCWRLSGSVLPTWVATQKPIRFWAVSIGNLVGAVGLLTLPQPHILLSDATESIRSTALVVSLMKESSVVFAIVTFTLVWVFSFVFAASVRAVQLRLFGNIYDQLKGSKN